MLAHAIKTTVTDNDVLDIIPTLTQGIARDLSPLLHAADMTIYKNFLVTMYHYTRYAEDQLLHASNLCKDAELKAYFYQMSREERGHYLLAKRDYEELGGNVEESIAPPFIKDFSEFWYGLGTRNVNEFVGAMYVFENVATLVAKDVIDMMQRLQLTRRQSRWLRVHLEADVGHGEEAMEVCRKYVSDDPKALLEAAQEAAVQWMTVFRHAFSNNG